MPPRAILVTLLVTFLSGTLRLRAFQQRGTSLPIVDKQSPGQETAPAQADFLAGQQILARKCSVCHSPPNPEMYPFKEWKHVFPQMAVNANLTSEEKSKLLAYVIKASETAPERRDTAWILNESRTALYLVDVERRELVNKLTFQRILGLTPNGRYAYVEQDGELRQINLAVNREKGELVLGQAINQLAVLPDNRRALASSTSSQDLLLVDLQENRLLAKLQVSASLHGFGATVDGQRVYLVDSKADQVLVIDTAAGEVIATIPVGKNPQHIAFPLAGRYAYVTNAGSDDVSVIAVASQKVIRTVSVGREPHGVLVTPLGSHVYVANSGSDSVSVIEVDTNEVTATLKVGRRPKDLAFTPDGRYVYVVNQGGDNSVTVIDTGIPEAVATIPVGEQPHEILIR